MDTAFSTAIYINIWEVTTTNKSSNVFLQLYCKVLLLYTSRISKYKKRNGMIFLWTTYIHMNINGQDERIPIPFEPRMVIKFREFVTVSKFIPLISN